MNRPEPAAPGGATNPPVRNATLSEAKDLYEMGEIPPLGHVPAKMYAWRSARNGNGPPEEACQLEVVPTWS